ncbi:MAG TPA: carboxymuconolactone decarboxylase family protein [Gemmatimonadaceae bacterium]|nr:carboxymuconolactone decarboxylase family protein [Gemmatimonadaceae bacterium]
MTNPSSSRVTVAALGDEERALVRLAAVIAAGSEADIRTELARAQQDARVEWLEEVILQSYLFAGFPRTLNAAREWRRVSGRPAPLTDDGEHLDRADEWRRQGEETCAIVYGPFYDRLRVNIRALHPALDAWMIVEGYGKVLSRPGLDLARRELCIVAACAASRQERQLHSHLHGALHAGASESAITDTLGAVASLVSADDAARHRMLWARVQGAADVH